MPEQDITNNKLGKFLSIEILGTMFAGAFAIGGVYATLSTQQTALAAEQERTAGKLERMERDVGEIKKDVAVMRNEQEHFNGKIDEQNDNIKRILDLLEKNHKH